MLKILTHWNLVKDLDGLGSSTRSSTVNPISKSVRVKTIVARLTPTMPAAIATLAVSGPQALSYVERFVRLSGAGLTVGSMRYGLWEVGLTRLAAENPTAELGATLNQNPTAERGATLEQVVLTRPAEDTVEVHCHGGAAVCQALLSDLVGAGCVAVPSEQWPSQLNCPLARAAQQDLLQATTDRAAAVLLQQLNGALRKAIESVAQRSASDAPAASASLEELLRWADFGLHLSQPWKIVLAGPPNVGKSSLLNALAGTRQAIVHHEPGTTRDWIEWSSAIDGWPVMFTDTAGVRSASEPVERAGVERSLQRLREADLALLVVDAQSGWTHEHSRLLELAPPRCLIVVNKVDLAGTEVSDLPMLDGNGFLADHEKSLGVVATSAIDGTGIANLLNEMARVLVPATPDEGAAIPFRIEQIECLRKCLTQLQRGEQLSAVASLREGLLGSERSA